MGRKKSTAPRNTEWRKGVLHGRICVKGKLHRWSLRTGDVEIARARVAENIEKLKAAEVYGDRLPLAVERRKWRNCPNLAEFHEPPHSPVGHIYVIGFRDYVKIGWSETVKARLVNLQNGVPENLVVYGIIEGTPEEECALHKRFREMRLYREWFRLAGSLEIWIDGGCKESAVETAIGVANRITGDFPLQTAAAADPIEIQ